MSETAGDGRLSELDALLRRIRLAAKLVHEENRLVTWVRTMATCLFLLSFLFLILACTLLAPQIREIRDVDPRTGEVTIRTVLTYFSLSDGWVESGGSSLADAEKDAVSPELCGSVTLCCAILMTITWLAPAARTQNLGFLKDVTDPRAVGPMMQMLDVREPNVRAAAVDVLARLLPQLSQAQISDLTGEQRSRLRRAICLRSAAEESQFQVEGIRVLSLSADQYSVPVLQSVASAVTHCNEEERMQAVARQMLPGLEKAVAEQKSHATLLRAAGEPEDAFVRSADIPSESLPRVAQASATSPALLLQLPVDLPEEDSEIS